MSITQLVRPLSACLAVVTVVALVAGCSHSDSGRTNDNSSGAQLASGKGGAELWSENCSRCHNLRAPDYYTPGRWAVVTQHMRVRGYLTGEETRQVTAFLQSQ